ncbi:hypothetical protein ACQR16_03165 [Bradyrhizobium oligotrophicum]|uniref:hypothetical protein n=1 Tax=Bradyrhizobium oligotrophicum TaxID=44255 RepID=UPI003EBCD020
MTAAAASEDLGRDDLGYPDVAAAMAGLRAKPGVRSSSQSGWIVFEDSAAQSVWSFPPSNHAAYPTAIRRRIVQQGNDIFVKMDVRCEAAKPACDAVVAEFARLNGQVRQNLAR